MQPISPYLNFSGNARQAMEFYQATLGGELLLTTVGESPVAAQLPAEAASQILHSTLTNGDMLIMGSDMMGKHVQSGNQVTLSVNCTSNEEITTLFNALADGGQIRDALQIMFWGAKFGAVTDKFGINWMFNYDNPTPAK